MKVDRTKYTAHYENGIIVAEWVSVEMALDGANGESAFDALDRSREIVDQWYKSKRYGFQNSSIPPGSTPIIQSRTDNIEIGVTPEMILSSPDLTILDSYRLIIKGKPELERAYLLRKDQLVQKENKQILDTTKAYYKEKQSLYPEPPKQ